MKRIKYIKYLLIFLFLPFVVLAENNNIEIKNISNYIEKSDTAEELEQPKIDGLKLGFKLKFRKQNDFIKYKFILKNNSDKDYEIDNQTTFNEKKYLRYDYEIENNNKILKAKEELIVNVIITYVKELEENEFENGFYKETNFVSLELVNDNQTIDNPIIKMVTNPDTSTGYIIITILALILSILIILLIKDNKSKVIILILLLIIPIFVYALEKIKIDVETYVEIEKKYEFVIINECAPSFLLEEELEDKYFEYMKGMTFADYMNSDYFTNLSADDKEMLNQIFVSNRMKYYNHDMYNCFKEIEFPSYHARMTPEEKAEIDRLLSIANEQQEVCRNTYGMEENTYLESEIKDSSQGIYYSNAYCPV